jgi:hypothetical protein
MKVRIAVGLGATAPDAGTFPAVVGALGPLGFDSLLLPPRSRGPARHRRGDAGIVGDAVDGVFPSDHRAVVADLRRRG